MEHHPFSRSTMESPFCRPQAYYPHTMLRRNPPSPPPSHPKKVKLRSIPIHYVGSETSRSESAVKIQKTFRGFRVRRNVKKIMAIRREVDEVEKKVEERETMELIKRDEKERVKMNELLMALLLKLDSVRGVDDGVRDFRKAVIKKAIILQEKIDSLVSAIDEDAENSGKFTDTVITDDSVNEGEIGVAVDDDDAMNFNNIVQTATHNAVNNGVFQVSVDDNDDACIFEKSADITTGNAVNEAEETRVDVDVNASDCDKIAADNNTIEDAAKEEIVNPEKIEAESWECVGEETEPKSDFINVNEVQNGGAESTKRANDDWFVVGRGEERKRSKEELLEKMVEDNQKLVAMVTDLCDKNANQASLISSLSQRVEQLEKTVNERCLRKKNKKKKNGVVNGFVHQ